MDPAKSGNPFAVIAFSLVMIGVLGSVVVPWMGEITLPAIAAAGILLGIPALTRAQSGGGKRGLALASLVLGGLALALFAFLKIFRT